MTRWDFRVGEFTMLFHGLNSIIQVFNFCNIMADRLNTKSIPENRNNAVTHNRQFTT